MGDCRLTACLLSTAVGDAIGLPYEGLSRRRAARMLGPPVRHRLVLGRGTVSDDTEHTCLVARALIGSAGEIGEFRCRLARGLRLWLLGLPAGIGLATLRATLRLWLGFGARRSGVRSAGNGPAMRAAIIGAAVEDLPALRDLVRAATRITHTDPKAEHGAGAVALAARTAARARPAPGAAFLELLRGTLGAEAQELVGLMARAVESAGRGEDTRTFADAPGLSRGVSGYAYHCVPLAIHAWLAHPRDLRSAVTAAVACGGDTDFAGAIAGGIVGAAVGRQGIPGDWLDGLAEWPRSVAWMERLAAQLARTRQTGFPERPLRLPAGAVLLRNALVLVVVLLHGLRRLLPPD
jgi:ADP-ribosylglycohydrolase